MTPSPTPSITNENPHDIAALSPDETLRADDIAYAEELSAALAAFQEAAFSAYPDGSLDAAAALTLAEIAGLFSPPLPQ